MMAASIYDRINKRECLNKVRDGIYFLVYDRVAIPTVGKVWKYTIADRIGLLTYNLYERGTAWKI